jgi:hypothetical protein
MSTSTRTASVWPGYQLTATEPVPNPEHLEIRLHQAWTVRHSSPDHRTQLDAPPNGFRTEVRDLAARVGLQG